MSPAAIAVIFADRRLPRGQIFPIRNWRCCSRPVASRGEASGFAGLGAGNGPETGVNKPRPMSVQYSAWLKPYARGGFGLLRGNSHGLKQFVVGLDVAQL